MYCLKSFLPLLILLTFSRISSGARLNGGLFSFPARSIVLVYFSGLSVYSNYVWHNVPSLRVFYLAFYFAFAVMGGLLRPYLIAALFLSLRPAAAATYPCTKKVNFSCCAGSRVATSFISSAKSWFFSATGLSTVALLILPLPFYSWYRAAGVAALGCFLNI